jgi:hypothetical protein
MIGEVCGSQKEDDLVPLPIIPVWSSLSAVERGPKMFTKFGIFLKYFNAAENLSMKTIISFQ